MGTEAVLLALVLLAIGVLVTYLGTRLSGAVGVKRPDTTIGVFMILIWVLCLATFEIAYATYAVQLYQMDMIQTPPINPISPITVTTAVATFIIIAYLSRQHGLKLAWAMGKVDGETYR